MFTFRKFVLIDQETRVKNLALKIQKVEEWLCSGVVFMDTRVLGKAGKNGEALFGNCTKFVKGGECKRTSAYAAFALVVIASQLTRHPDGGGNTYLH